MALQHKHSDEALHQILPSNRSRCGLIHLKQHTLSIIVKKAF